MESSQVGGMIDLLDETCDCLLNSAFDTCMIFLSDLLHTPH